jgi:aldose 1-epimerase
MVIRPFGTTPAGEPTQVIDVGPTTAGLSIAVSDLGATLVRLRTPDRTGNAADVVLGFDAAAGYLGPDNAYLGATVGRVANRISGATFELDGRRYELARNEGPNHLHGGGGHAFSWRLWRVEEATETAVALGLRSPDGEEGYPGRLDVLASYTLDGDTLTIRYVATTDAPTPVNLTNHAYFDLDGAGSGTVHGHVVRLRADAVTATDEALLPTGELHDVAGTPLDLNEGRVLREAIAELAGTPARGFDHNYVLGHQRGPLRAAAEVISPASGRRLELATTEPGLQLYTGQHLASSLTGRDGRRYGPFSGLCLEPQVWPDAINVPGFPEVVLGPGERYEHVTQLRFSTV